IEDYLNTGRDGRPKQGPNIKVTAMDLIRAAPYQRALSTFRDLPDAAAKALEDAFSKNDLSAITRAFDELGISAKPVWAARLFRNLPEGNTDSVALRADPAGQIASMHAELDRLREAIAASGDGKQKSALREDAAELFARMINVAGLMSRNQRYEAG